MYKIMIVDDELIEQDMLQKFIEQKLDNYEVLHICSNGKEALEAFQEKPVDIILVDVRMPVMDGLTFLEKLNAISTNYAAIIVSSYNEFDYAKAAIRLGVCHYLLKPVDFKELTEAIHAATHSLHNKQLAAKIAQNSVEDMKEMYFTDLLSGKYQQPEAARKDFDEIGCDFPYDSKGIYLNIGFTNVGSWTYGHDELITAIRNILMMTYHPMVCIPIMQSENGCNFLLFVKDMPKSLDVVCKQIYYILNVLVSAKELLEVHSVEELRNCVANGKLAVQNNDMPYEDSEELPENVLKQRINNAMEYIETHYAEDLSRDTIAEAVFVSSAYFSRSFKSIAGISYKDYLTEIRMKKAIELLNTSMKIADIAFKVGYSNPNRFNINFRQYTSYTPSEYRTKVLKML